MKEKRASGVQLEHSVDSDGEPTEDAIMRIGRKVEILKTSTH